MPLDWAMTQNNLGNALSTLGERESGTARLEEAVAAYRAALEEWTRERVPLDWAMTQNNLGTALSSARRARERHGAAGGGGRRLSRGAGGTDARARAAPLGDDAEQPRQRALDARRAGERHGAAGGGGRRLSSALKERTRERVPLNWALTQENLAIVFRVLATRTTGDARLAYLRDALAAVDGALEVYRAGNAAYYIEKAERLRARILAETQQAQAPPR